MFENAFPWGELRILKWKDLSYEVVWRSPEYKERGTKLLVTDVLGRRGKQLIVGTGSGAIEIWALN